MYKLPAQQCKLRIALSLLTLAFQGSKGGFSHLLDLHFCWPLWTRGGAPWKQNLISLKEKVGDRVFAAFMLSRVWDFHCLAS